MPIIIVCKLHLNLNFHWLPVNRCFFSHQGAVEGCGLGFTKFCTSLLNSSDSDLKDIPAQMLKDVSNFSFVFN